MTSQVLLRLGRVSNLPTVWTNVLAGVVLAGAKIELLPLAILFIALSLFYIAGMYLNDAFDHEVDARERPERPIPSGQISVRVVFTAGLAMLAVGEALLALVGFVHESGHRWGPVVSGLVLALAILYYNSHHKGNPLSPLVMGFCRVLVYVIAALSVAPKLTEPVLLGAVVLLAYVAGLTYAARQENLTEFQNLWPLACLAIPFIYGATGALGSTVGLGIYFTFLAWVIYGVSHFVGRKPLNIPSGVVILIAGISFLDALLIANQGEAPLAVIAVAGVVLTRLFQRFVPGT